MDTYKALKPEGVEDSAWVKVIDAWTNGLSDREASFRASIKESDIKKWCKDNPDIAKLRDLLHGDILAHAKLNIANEIAKGNASVSKWYLERKAANEFSSKSAVSFENAVVELTLEDKEKKVAELMEDFGNE